ncbi:uncharacterized protein Bfra_005219 [Botrytis fragariae]|uniref:Uncharacterized protein n=1 Tax=Botrytis fragariae TaxID=1964551 RepID=A0A8H6AUP0_9HELO|nr:uncharacterized protein Bfra_005219 [Botrytis fragariae]KAF5873755.1 hypothetical protein Bfra_005219 [Botrytis fragariae]
MTSPTPTLQPKAKPSTLLSLAAGIPLSAPSSIPTRTTSPTKTSTKIKLQLKNKHPALRAPSEGTPVGASSSAPTEAMSPTKKSTKIKLQLKNKHPALPAPSEGVPLSAPSSMPTGTMSPTKRPTEIENLLKKTASRTPLTWPPETPRVYDRDFYRPNRRTQTETPFEPELQGHENESAAVTSSNEYATDDNSSPSTLAHTDGMPIEAPSLEDISELLLPSNLATLSITTQAALLGPWLRPTSSSTNTEKTTPTKPSKIVILKLSPAKLATLSTSTQAAWTAPSLEPTSSSSNLASSTIAAPHLPIAATSSCTYSSRGRLIHKTYKTGRGGTRNNAVAQNAVAQNAVAQNAVAQNAGQKRKATNKAATSSKKRVKFAENQESAEATQSRNGTVARRMRIKIGTRFPPLRTKARAKVVLEASREARQRAHLLAWQEEAEARNRRARAKMGNLLRDWEALEKQRDRETEQANTGAL